MELVDLGSNTMEKKMDLDTCAEDVVCAFKIAWPRLGFVYANMLYSSLIGRRFSFTGATFLRESKLFQLSAPVMRRICITHIACYVKRGLLETKLQSTEDTRRCGRAGEVLSREGIHERGRHLQRQEKQAPEMRQASSTKRGARSKDGLWDEARRTGDS